MQGIQTWWVLRKIQSSTGTVYKEIPLPRPGVWSDSDQSRGRSINFRSKEIGKLVMVPFHMMRQMDPHWNVRRIIDESSGYASRLRRKTDAKNHVEAAPPPLNDTIIYVDDIYAAASSPSIPPTTTNSTLAGAWVDETSRMAHWPKHTCLMSAGSPSSASSIVVPSTSSQESDQSFQKSSQKKTGTTANSLVDSSWRRRSSSCQSVVVARSRDMTELGNRIVPINLIIE